jgi:hypothetical protein
VAGDFGKGLLLNGGYYNFKSLCPGGIQYEKGELAIAGNQAEFFGRRHR